MTARGARFRNTTTRGGAITVSGDSRYVGRLITKKLQGYPKFDNSALFVYRASDLSQHLLSIPLAGPGFSLPAFADKTHRLFHLTDKGVVSIYRGNGDLIRQVPFGDVRRSTDGAVGHASDLSPRPDGQGLLAITYSHIYYFDLPVDPTPAGGGQEASP